MIAGQKRFADFRPRGEGAERKAVGNAFSEREDVRLDTDFLAGNIVPVRPKLVCTSSEMKSASFLSRNGFTFGKYSGGGTISALSHDRLSYHCRNIPGGLRLEDPLYLIGAGHVARGVREMERTAVA